MGCVSQWCCTYLRVGVTPGPGSLSTYVRQGKPAVINMDQGQHQFSHVYNTIHSHTPPSVERQKSHHQVVTLDLKNLLENEVEILMVIKCSCFVQKR